MNLYRNNLTIGDIPQLDVVVPSFIPFSTDGLNLWLKADSLSLSDGDQVSSWNDSSGNGNNATQSNSSYKPIFKTGILNGKPVVRFTASDDHIICPNGVFSGVSTETSMFIVMKVTNISSEKFNFTQSVDNASNRYSTHTPYSDGKIYWDFGNISGNGRLSGSWGGDSSSFYYWGYLAGSGMAIRRNGTQIHTKSTSGTFTPGTQTFIIGGKSGSEGMSGDIAEVIMYNRRLNLTEIGEVETYLKNKYNL